MAQDPLPRDERSGGSGPPNRPRLIGTAAVPGTPNHLDPVLGRIEQEGRARFAESYAGLEVMPDQLSAVVYRVPSAQFDAFLREVAGEAAVVIRDAPYSVAELTALMERITADLDYWRERGIRINAFGARHDGSGVQVGTQEVARAEVELPKRYGARPPVLIVEEGPILPL